MLYCAASTTHRTLCAMKLNEGCTVRKSGSFTSFSQSVLALCVAISLLGCTDNDSGSGINEYYRDTPSQVGNTIDRFNDLSVTFPRSANVSISYAFEAADQGTIETVNDLNGPNWLFVERTASIPEIFLQVHLVTPGPATERERGTLVRLGKKRFQSQLFCLDPDNLDLTDERQRVLAVYLNDIKTAGFEMSQDVYIRRYVAEALEIDGRRFDVLYVHDLTRMGHRCADIGDPQDPSSDFEELIDTLNDLAGRSWEIVG